jgi:UDP-N-acetylenolpyruvoylglucosamine reductase
MADPHCSAAGTVSNTLALPCTPRFLCRAENTAQVLDAAVFASAQNLPLLAIGEGSNVVLPPALDACVLQVVDRTVKVLSEDARHSVLRIGAGKPWHELVLESLREQRFGLENLALIPGSVGAAPVQNIGAYGRELSEFVIGVHGVDLQQQQARHLSPSECGFAYRDSVFKQGLRDRFVITAVDLRLYRQPRTNISYPALRDRLPGPAPTPQEICAAVIALRQERLPDPASHPNAGSFFKNPLVNRVSSYFRNSGLNAKTMALVMRIRDIQVTVTSTEADALLLEQQPDQGAQAALQYPARDDKSYPYIFPVLQRGSLSAAVGASRAASAPKGVTSGPIPVPDRRAPVAALSAEGVQGASVRGQLLPQPLAALPAVPDRSLHGALRGPGVGEEYAEQVDKTVLFLRASPGSCWCAWRTAWSGGGALEYERAAELRDQMQHLQQVQNTQGIEGSTGRPRCGRRGHGGWALLRAGAVCARCPGAGQQELLSRCAWRGAEKPRCWKPFCRSFICAASSASPERFFSVTCPRMPSTLAEVFSDAATRRVRLRERVRESRARWLQLALQTAETNLAAQLSGQAERARSGCRPCRNWSSEVFPQRIECFDISHSSGEATVASCVVFDTAGAQKSTTGASTSATSRPEMTTRRCARPSRGASQRCRRRLPRCPTSCSSMAAKGR